MLEPEDTLASDLLWGVDAIAAFIGRTPRQVYDAVEKNQLPARKVNGRWVASRSVLRETLTGRAA